MKLNYFTSIFFHGHFYFLPGFNEILNFYKMQLQYTINDYLHGIAYPDPFTSIIDNKNGMRVVRGLLLQVTGIICCVSFFNKL